MPPLSAGRGRGQLAAESLHSLSRSPSAASRCITSNVKIDDTAVSVRDFSTGLNWQEKNLTLTPTSLQGLLIALPRVAKVAQEQVVEPKIDNPQPQEKPARRDDDRPLLAAGAAGDDRMSICR